MFTFAEPYFEETFSDFKNDTMRIFFKYTNDNNPFLEATILPMTVLDGLGKIGGYFALFGILKVFLFFYNRSHFEESLKKRYKQIIEDHKEGKPIVPESFTKPLDPDNINENVIHETLSYEMMMILAVFYSQLMLEKKPVEKVQVVEHQDILEPPPTQVVRVPANPNRKQSSRSRKASAGFATGDEEEYKTSREYGAEEDNGTEFERLEPVAEAPEIKSNSIQKDTQVEEELAKRLSEGAEQANFEQ